MWLYIQLSNEHNFEISENTKDMLLDLLEDLQSKEGFFRANLSEKINGNENSYLMSTKMALDIYYYFNIRNQKN
ncbi:hypothetical protein HMSSN036_74440 [Paenibacillus macerans]|nr:hypothetical protein HMSSN036_74440 [Paenibacillus macerans]